MSSRATASVGHIPEKFGASLTLHMNSIAKSSALESTVRYATHGSLGLVISTRVGGCMERETAAVLIFQSLCYLGSQHSCFDYGGLESGPGATLLLSPLWTSFEISKCKAFGSVEAPSQ
jgi:hypothetical protein